MNQEESKGNPNIVYELRKSFEKYSIDFVVKVCGNCTKFKRYSNPTASSNRGFCMLKENSVERNEHCSFYQEVH
jgi:hypothetical protein